ncbi:MAG: hypothetical protein FJ405_01620, partial [Verrucomicrobia bacterium]|nr:hypothetical protein [Verrucomicrobiota bacterium]
LFGNDPASWTGALATPGRSFVPADAPVITQQPQGATVVGGTSASLSVVATGRAPLTYQWRRDGQNIGGATSATLTLNPILVSEAGSYTVIVLDGNGSVESTAAELIVLQPAVIVEQPESQNVRPGLTATFRVVAIGTGQLRYQWTKDGQDIPGATTSTLTVRNLVLEDTGDYRVRVTDSIGAALSSVARLAVLVRPVYTVQPLSVVALVGEDVTFSADATGLEPIAYRWRRGNTPIPGAVGKTYVLANVQLTNAGLYSCVATNLATGTSGTNSTQALLVVMNDSDGDGMGDQWEAVYGFSSSNAADAAQDTDGDNHTNLQEFQAGTNPKDKTSFLKIDSISVSANGASIGFLGQSNRVYTLQFRDDLGQGNWQNLGNVGGTTSQRPLIVIDPNREADERYYRLLAPPAK